MIRLFRRSNLIKNGSFLIEEKQDVHYLKDVRRVKKGDAIVIFDESGNDYDCLVQHVSKDLLLSVERVRFSSGTADRVKITIACAIPKRAKMPEIVDKLAQLGTDKLIPLLTGRVIVKLNSRKEDSVLMRWRKIAIGASQQCKRNDIMTIAPVTKIKDLLSASADFDLKLIPTLAGERKTLNAALGNKKYRNILVLIGPEGDFTDNELAHALRAGFTPVSLGDYVLRVDTAAVAVASYLRLAL